VKKATHSETYPFELDSYAIKCYPLITAESKARKAAKAASGGPLLETMDQLWRSEAE